MLKIQYTCDACGFGVPSISKDLKTVICKECAHEEKLDLPVQLEEHIPKIKMRKFIAIAPDGKRYEVVGVGYFARKFNLDSGRVNASIKDPEKACNGWKFIDRGMALFHTTAQREAARKNIKEL